MKVRLSLLGLAMAAVSAAGLSAQERESPCPYVYPAPEVGQYAEVQFTNVENGTMTIRFSVVGEEPVKGRKHYWVEVATIPPAVGEPVIAKMLVPYYPFEYSDVKSYIVQMPGQPPRKAPQQMIDLMAADTGPGPSWKEHCANAEDLGIERVTVPAGSFQTRHFRAKGEDKGEIWIGNVPFGMVKLTQADGSMELLSYGSDAKTAITQKPVEMDQPPPR